MSGKISNDDRTIQAIWRLFEEPLPEGAEPCPWYAGSTDAVDCNQLHQIPEDDDFIDAVMWQIQGTDTFGRKRRRWVKRLRRSSRSSIMLAMRLKTKGRRYGAKVPGIWLALLFDPPGRRFLGHGLLGKALDRCRHRVVAWRYGDRSAPAKESQATKAGTER